MKILELSAIEAEAHRFGTVLARPALCAEIVASVAESIQATRDQMHPQINPSIRGMHAYAHAMTNIGYATEPYGGRLKTVHGQQRIVFAQTEGVGEIQIAYAKGTPVADGFDVTERGPATEQLIGIAYGTLDLDLPGVPTDDSAFFVHHLVADPKEPLRHDVVVYLAHPARLNDKKTFLYCDECVLLGRRPLRVVSRTPATLFDVSADVVPQVGVRRS